MISSQGSPFVVCCHMDRRQTATHIGVKGAFMLRKFSQVSLCQNCLMIYYELFVFLGAVCFRAGVL